MQNDAERLRVTVLLLLGIAAVSVAADAERAPVIPQSVQEARRVVEGTFAAINQGGKAPPGWYAWQPTALLPLLDSEQRAVRLEGVEAFRKLVFRAIALDPCLPYLAPTRPADERLPLLAVCTGCLGRPEVKGVRSEEAQRVVAGFVQDALNGSLCPPSFDLLCAALARQHRLVQSSRRTAGIPVTTLVRGGEEALVGRRFLAVLTKADKVYELGGLPAYEKGCRDVFEMVLALGEKHTGELVEDWYRSEPDPQARVVVVDPSLSWAKSAEWQTRRKKVLELATGDWDEDIASRAKAVLAAPGKAR